jgi:para-nitrobenzyl esterase
VSILGIAPADISKLRSMPIDELIGAANPLAEHVAMTLPGNIAFQPTIDGDLLPQHPMKAIAAGSAKDIPLMLGTNHGEASIFAMMHPPSLPTTPERIHALFQHTDAAAEARVTAAYPHFPAKSARLAFGGDVTFRIPSIRVAEAQSQYAPTWMYRFDWASWLMKARGLGAFHALEIAFVFDTLDTSLGKLITALTRKHVAQSLSQRMHRAWLNFARTGNPNAAEQNEWLNYDTPKRATMIFDSKDHLEFDPAAEQRQAWEGVNC